MKKIFLFLFILLPTSVLLSQVDADRYWIGGSSVNWNDGANWSTSNGGAASNDYPSGNNAIAWLASGNNQITINTDITLNRLIVAGTGTPNGTNYEISASNSSVLTLKAIAGGSKPQVISFSKGGAALKFMSGTKVVLNGAQNHVLKFNPTSGTVSFLDGSELTVSANKNFNIQSTDGSTCHLYLKGTIKGSGDIKFFGNSLTTFGETVNMTNFTGDLRNDTSNTKARTVNINGPVKAAIAYLAAAGTVNVQNTGSLEISGNFQTAGTAKVVVKAGTGTGSYGSIKATATTAAAIKIEFQKPLDDKQADDSTREWTITGSPVTGETLADLESQSILSTKDGKVGFGDWDNAAEAFDYYTIGATKTLTPGTGYLATVDNDAVLSFTGQFNKTATVQVPVTDEDGTYGNWNMVSNPYVSYINMTDDSGDATNNFLTENAGNIHNSYEAVYAWNGTTYVIYNQTTNTKNFIAPGEAFFVYVRDNPGATMNMNFKEAMQVVSKGAGFNAATVEGASKPYSRFNIQLQDSENNQTDELFFYFSNKNSKGLDPGYDAGKFNLSGPNSKIFSRLVEQDEETSGIDFQIQALSNYDLRDAVVPIGIETNSSKIKLSISENSLDHLYNVYLEDRLKNTIVRFDSEIELDFGEPQTGIGRFYLHFTDGMIPELPTDGDDFRIYKVSNNEIRLMGEPDKIYKAKVFDFSGRLIDVVEFKHRVNIDKLDNQSIKILTIEDKDKKLTKKFQLK